MEGYNFKLGKFEHIYIYIYICMYVCMYVYTECKKHWRGS